MSEIQGTDTSFTLFLLSPVESLATRSILLFKDLFTPLSQQPIAIDYVFVEEADFIVCLVFWHLYTTDPPPLFTPDCL